MKNLTAQQIKDAAKSIGIEEAMLRAVMIVEAGGRSGFWNNVPGFPGEIPVINFEAQHFRMRTKGKFDKTNPEVSAPGLDKQFGKSEWKRFSIAAKLDRKAAIESTSWGMFQIMGFNHKACGFADVESFLKAHQKDELEQLKAFLKFIQGPRLKALQQKNFSEFARLYNGARYKELKYDTKLLSAYKRAGGSV